jgi:class III poly(R)-hydroxyalkanoic acid synthase PhaE subunit
MDWQKQTESMFSAWMETQQSLWKNWTDLVTQGTSSPPDMVQMWQDMVQQGVDAWTQNAPPTVQDVVGQMMSSQQALMRMVEMSMHVWQDTMQAVADGAEWQTELGDQMNKIRDELLQNATGGVNAAKNMTQLWQTYVSQWQGFLSPWSNAFQQTTPSGIAAMMGDRDALLEMTGLYWDAYQDSFGQLLRAPGLGYSREWDEKVRHGFAAWLDMQQAAYEYQVMMADTWVKAFEELISEMAGEAKKGETLGLREFVSRWSGIADRVFKTAFAAPEFVEVQSQFINMMMRYRIRQREVAEVIWQLYDVPTREEVDEAHRRIYELRKEVKALKKDVASLKTKKKTPAKRKKKADSE